MYVYLNNINDTHMYIVCRMMRESSSGAVAAGIGCLSQPDADWRWLLRGKGV